MISFDNTTNAFVYKSTRELKKAYRLFWLMGKAWLVRLGTKILPWAVKQNIPFVRFLIRHTIFKEFVGGETLKKTMIVTNRLKQYHIGVILDYGVEGGKSDNRFDHSADEFIHAIRYAGTQKNIPFVSIKISSIARFTLLEKISSAMPQLEGKLIEQYTHVLGSLNEEEKREWNKVTARMMKICEIAHKQNIGLLIDAEETWIQNTIDAMSALLMQQFNRHWALVFNTIQMYRRDRMQFLADCYTTAVEEEFILGIKLVRGAYMEKERERAKLLNYPSPIVPEKKSCDREYNDAMAFCVNRLAVISLIVASHNEESNLLATQLLHQYKIPNNHPHIHFSQLYGMSDHVSFNLAKEGYLVSKYLPFGPLIDVIPYLMRRAEENTAVSGQTGRELQLIKKELRRRGTQIELSLF
jgi:proline dehydrogenase